MKIKLGDLIIYFFILLAFNALAIRLFNFFASFSNYPLSTYWGESGVIYNSYTIFNYSAKNGISPFPWLDPARALLGSLVFFLPSTTILMWRVWSGLISFIIIAVTAFLVVHRTTQNLKIVPARKITFLLLLSLFGLLFLLQGPIHAHLLIGIIPILLFYQHDQPKVTAIVIAICAIWSGLTRINWFFMPAIIASLFYVFNQPRQKMPVWQYFRWPFIWGMINLIISLPIYFWAIDKANKPYILSPAMDYAFDVSKLWPNIGYAFGLVLGIILITVPSLLIIMRYLWLQRCAIDKLRTAFILLLLTILAAGSTLVSLRSGGGYELHNYDSFLLVIFILTIQTGLHIIQPDESNHVPRLIFLNPATTGVLLVVPILLSVYSLRPLPTYNYAAAQNAIEGVNLALKENTSTEDSQVLFIDYRTLVIFGQVPPRPIYAPYERIELMEMAMAQNENYFREFDKALQHHKFDVIITPLLRQENYHKSEDPWWYETNSWSTYVATPILEYYELIYTNSEADLSIYYPKN